MLKDTVVAAQSGNREAYGRLVSAYSRQVCSFLSARCVRWEQVEEIAQDAFVSGWESIDQLQDPLAFPSWVKGIARNLLQQERRVKARERLEPLDAIYEQLALTEHEEAEVTEPPSDRLAHCLGQLSPRARLLCTRRLVDGIPLARLAQQFKQNEAALASVLRRIRTQLRLCLDAAT